MISSLRKMSSVLVFSIMIALSSVAMAQDDDESDRPDARTEGYLTADGKVQQIVLKDGGGHATTWFILAGLGLLGLGVMFKTARRTHLD